MPAGLDQAGQTGLTTWTDTATLSGGLVPDSAATGALVACSAALVLLDGLAVRFSMGAFGITIDAPVLATGLARSAYDEFGQRYHDALAQYGVDVVLLVGASPALAQTRGPATAQEQLYSPIGGGGSGGGTPGYPDPMVNSFGKCWINIDKANYQLGDCPHEAHKGGHH